MRLSRLAKLPTYAHDTDAGFDLYSAESKYVLPGETVVISTGIAIDIPKGYEIQVRPRSGVTRNTKLRVQLGTIDAGYRGDIGIIVDNIDTDSDNPEYIGIGDRIAQAVLAPVSQAKFKEVAEFEGDTQRGANGFGSTGVSK